MDLVSGREMMLKFISHRGNLNGPNPSRENHPDYILEAINKGYNVEIDLRMFNGELMLGHDEPQYEVELLFLVQHISKLWVHCKDYASLDFVSKYTVLNFFSHFTDEPYVLTSHGQFWAYPGQLPLGTDCVMVMPELHWKIPEIVKFNTYGVCSDYIADIKEL
jgi:hypothetical protein